MQGMSAACLSGRRVCLTLFVDLSLMTNGTRCHNRSSLA